MTADSASVAETDGREGAPGDLGLVQAFLNSADVDTGLEEFTDRRALARWLRQRDLIGARERVSDEELARALELREALREVLAAHSGLPVDERALRVVNAASAAAPVAVVIDPDCASALRPAAGGFDGAIARTVRDHRPGRRGRHLAPPEGLRGATTACGCSTTARATAPLRGATWRSAATARRLAPSATGRRVRRAERDARTRERATRRRASIRPAENTQGSWREGRLRWRREGCVPAQRRPFEPAGVMPAKGAH